MNGRNALALVVAGLAALGCWSADPVRAVVEDDGGDLRITDQDYEVPAGASVNQNIFITNGSLTVRGFVNGNIKQTGAGSVAIRGRGVVNGNIEESDSGGVFVVGRATLKGNLQESGNGVVRVRGPESGESVATVFGNISEADGGNVEVTSRATVKGNVDEKGNGTLIVDDDTTIDGNQSED